MVMAYFPVRNVVCILVWLLFLGPATGQCILGDCENGQGSIRYADGSTFTGEFVDGNFRYGVRQYANGERYEGEFSQNRRHGQGSYEYVSGGGFSGTFEMGEKRKGTYLSPDGDTTVGYWQANRYMGPDSADLIRTFAVVVGIARYHYLQGLTFPAADARRFARYLRNEASLPVPSHQLTVLIDSQATRVAILTALRRQFQRADSNDRVIFYFSGHGHQAYFCPVEVDPLDDATLLSHAEIKQCFLGSAASHKLMIADACDAGAMARLSGAASQPQDPPTTAPPEALTLAVLLSCQPQEQSWEHSDLQQGVFSYYLMQALSGNPQLDRDGDQVLSIEELYHFVYHQTRQFVRSRHGADQRPVLFGHFNPDLPVRLIRHPSSG